jgi:hypothetical protein
MGKFILAPPWAPARRMPPKASDAVVNTPNILLELKIHTFVTD